MGGPEICADRHPRGATELNIVPEVESRLTRESAEHKRRGCGGAGPPWWVQGGYRFSGTKSTDASVARTAWFNFIFMVGATGIEPVTPPV